MVPDLTQALSRRIAEREALLQRSIASLNGDERVDAAWLFGSMGRGDADALSDLDLFVVVADAHLDSVIAERPQFMAAQGDLLLVLEAPQNRPPGGAYNMAIYAGVDGPHQVDWYWQARSQAQVPSQTRLLLDRAGLPCSEHPPHFDYQPVDAPSPIEAANRAIQFFWAMLLITAKYAARSPFEETMALLPYVQGALRNVQTFVGSPVRSEEAPLPHPSPEEQVAVLRPLLADMEPLIARAATLGCQTLPEIASAAHRYLDLIARLCRTNWRPQPSDSH